MQIGLLRALGVVAQADDLPEACQHRGIMAQPAKCAAPFALLVRPAVLVTVDVARVRGLLNLPGLDAHATPHISEEKVERLLERVSTVLAREEQEVTHPPHQVRRCFARAKSLSAKNLSNPSCTAAS